MDILQKTFFGLLKNALYSKNECFEYAQKDGLLEMAKTHKCIPFIYIGAKNAGFELPDDFKNHMTINAVRNQLYMKIQTHIINALKNAGITCAVLKGSSVSVNYPEPMARTMGDIDILVNEEDYDKAISIFCVDDIDDSHAFHSSFVLNGITIEIHKYVTEYTSEKYGDFIKNVMSDALKNTLIKRIDEFEFPVLEEKFQAATLLLHKQRHFFENLLPIRMLCDWAMFIGSVDAKKWEEEIYPFVSKMGLGEFCDVMVSVCNKYLGSNCLDKVIGSVDEKLVDSIIIEFIHGGVEKEVDSLSRNIGSRISQNRINSKGIIRPLIMFLNEIARTEFSIAKKSDIFLPLCWIYIFFRYVARVFLGKRSMFKINTFTETADRKEYIIKRLNLKD